MLAKDLVAASARPLILSILEVGESYGYAITRRVRELSEEKIEWADGMLYPVLRRLEGEGLIASEWRQEENGRERRYYTLTRDGGRALKTEKAQWLTVHNTLCRLWKLRPVSI